MQHHIPIIHRTITKKCILKLNEEQSGQVDPAHKAATTLAFS